MRPLVAPLAPRIPPRLIIDRGNGLKDGVLDAGAITNCHFLDFGSLFLVLVVVTQ
jgi:hypothetical protein